MYPPTHTVTEQVLMSLKQWIQRHRIKPLVALRAIKQLLQHPDDTGQVFKIIEALKGDSITPPVQRLRRHAPGVALLRDKPDIKMALNDRDRLASLPLGSIGRTYYDFIYVEGLSADRLVASSEEAPRYDTLSPDERWFVDRLRDIHDLQHVMTGYGRDPLGELSLLSFMTTQVYNRGINFIIFMGARKLQREHPTIEISALVAEGQAIGEQAAWMPSIRWEDRLQEPLEAVREELGFRPPIAYLASHAANPLVAH